MCSSILVDLLLSIGVMLTPMSHQQPSNSLASAKEPACPIIDVTGVETDGKILRLNYEIRNESKHYIWILVGFRDGDDCAELFMHDNGQTIVIRRRFDVLFDGGGETVYGRYVRLRPGEAQSESISVPVPVHPVREFAGRRSKQGLELATAISIEIGFYTGDLPWMIRRVLEEMAQISDLRQNKDMNTIKQYFRGLLQFNEFNEGVISREDEVVVPYTYQALRGEQILETTISGLVLPYIEEEAKLSRQYPNLSSCTRIEIQCKPSALLYFFPFECQQSLLTPDERIDLKSLETIIIDEKSHLEAFAEDVRKGILFSPSLVRERSTAHVVCYRESEVFDLFTIYNDSILKSEGNRQFKYASGFPSIRMLTPQVRPLELRVQCAANLRNLWHRFLLYSKAEEIRQKDSSGKSEVAYPLQTEWCDAMTLAYQSAGMPIKNIMAPHVCPSAADAKNHYALNPNCGPDSSADMVLLFETKAGWNQNGGPELFTFDNHDPKGGCVLLNDGTVKFIRTKEELQQLRWK